MKPQPDSKAAQAIAPEINWDVFMMKVPRVEVAVLQ
jgi:hypothetical protein